MVVIRLARTGKKKQAFYRVVIADSKRAVTAKFIEIVGWYNPHTKELNLKEDQIKNWLEKGAQPSNTVAVLLKNAGFKLPKWVEIKEKVSKSKNPEAEVKEAPAQEAPVAEEAAPEETVEATEAEATETPEVEVAETSETETEAPAEEEAETPAE